MPLATAIVTGHEGWLAALAQIATAVARAANKPLPFTSAHEPGDEAQAIAQSLLSGERKAILLGNAAAHHAQASALLALVNWIGEQTGASVGYLTEAANTVGAQFVGAQPKNGGLDAGRMLAGGLQAALLLHCEPEFDSAAGQGAAALGKAGMVVTLNAFKTNLEFSDVLLPVAPFSETPGSFVNAEGRVQSFHAVVRPLAAARPAWKVLRVLANMLEIEGFEFESAADVLARARGPAQEGATHLPADRLSNAASADIEAALAAPSAAAPVVASIYQLDGLARRAPALQRTADARRASEVTA
jgi:NADH-quinone oxidoreductase subunit G